MMQKVIIIPVVVSLCVAGAPLYGSPTYAADCLAPRSRAAELAPGEGNKEEMILWKLVRSFNEQAPVRRVIEDIQQVKSLLGSSSGFVFALANDQVLYFSLAIDGKEFFFRYSVMEEPELLEDIGRLLVRVLHEDPSVDIAPLLEHFQKKRESARATVDGTLERIPKLGVANYRKLLGEIDLNAYAAEDDLREYITKKIRNAIDIVRKRKDLTVEQQNQMAIAEEALNALENAGGHLAEAEKLKASLMRLFAQPDVREAFLRQLNALIEKNSAVKGMAVMLRSRAREELIRIVDDPAVKSVDQKIDAARQLKLLFPAEGRGVMYLGGLLKSADQLTQRKALDALGDISAAEYCMDMVRLMQTRNQETRERSRAALFKVIAKETSVKNLMQWKDEIKLLAVDRFELPLFAGVYNRINHRILALDPAKKGKWDRIVEIRTYSEGPAYYECVSAEERRYSVKKNEKGEYEIESLQGDKRAPVTDLEEYALALGAVQDGLTGETTGIVGWRTAGPQEIRVFRDRAELQSAFADQYAANPVVRFFCDRAISLESIQGRPAFKTVADFFDFITADAPTVRGKYAAEEIIPRIEFAGRPIRAGYVPATRTILPAIFHDAKTFIQFARDVAGRPVFEYIYKALLDEYAVQIQTLACADLNQKLSAVWPLWGEYFDKPEQKTFYGILSLIGVVQPEMQRKLEMAFVKNDPEFGTAPQRAFQRGMLKVILQLLAAHRVLKKDIVQMAVSHEIAHLIYESILTREQRAAFSEYAKKRLGAEPALKEKLLTLEQREMRPPGSVEPGSDGELFALILESLAYPRDDFTPAAGDLQALDDAGVLPPTVSISLDRAFPDAIAPDNPLRQYFDAKLRAVEFPPSSAAHLPILVVSKYVPDEAVEDLLFMDDALVRDYGIDVGSRKIEESDGREITVMGAATGTMYVSKDDRKKTPDILVLADGAGQRVVRLLTVKKVMERDFRGVTTVYVFQKPRFPTPLENLARAELVIDKIVIKERRDVTAALTDIVREQLTSLYGGKISVLCNQPLGELIDMLGTMLKDVDQRLGTKLIDELFLEAHPAHRPGGVTRDFSKQPGMRQVFQLSPDNMPQQVDYLCFVCGLLVDRLKLTRSGKGIEEQARNISTQARMTFKPLLDVMLWGEGYAGKIRDAAALKKGIAPQVIMRERLMPATPLSQDLNDYFASSEISARSL